MPIALSPLPYPHDALEPVISARTLEVHHGRHHAGYVEKLNAAIAGSDLAAMPLEVIVRRAARGRTNARRTAIFNNAAQAWNHQFFWDSLRPAGGPGPDAHLASRIQRDFGGQDEFEQAFKAAAGGVFGSGWAWLVVHASGRMELMTTANADTPIVHGRTPLLVIDTWEHAYYLDYQQRRADYVNGVVDRLLDWDFASANLKRWEAGQRATAFSLEAGHA